MPQLKLGKPTPEKRELVLDLVKKGDAVYLMALKPTGEPNLCGHLFKISKSGIMRCVSIHPDIPIARDPDDSGNLLRLESE